MKKILVVLPALMLVSACEYLPSWMGGEKKEIVRLPGEREDVLNTQQALKTDDSLQQIALRLPAVTENSAWAQHTGQLTAASSNLSVKGDLTVSQSAEAGSGNEFSHSLVPRPVVADGKIYAMDSHGVISAHDSDSIKNKLWTSPVLVTSNEDEVMGGGMAVDGGRLYAVSGAGRVAALDAASGTEVWRRDIGIPLRSAPRVAGGKIFIISIDSQLFALDAGNGSTLWTHRGIGEAAGIMSNISPTVASDMVLAPYGSGELYALKQDSGDEVWRESLAQARRTEATAIFSGIGGDPVVDDSVVFAVSNGGLFSVYSILNGQPLWQAKIASFNTPWVVGDHVYTLTEENLLVALVKFDGRIRWTTQLKRFHDEERSLRPIVWRGPVMVNDKLVLVSTFGEMVQVDAGNGSILSTTDVAENISTAPVVANGSLFVIDKEANLYSYQ